MFETVAYIQNSDELRIYARHICGCIDETVLGVGIDIAPSHDFTGPAGKRFSRLLFLPQELASIEDAPCEREIALASLFAAKEAAFKCTSSAMAALPQDVQSGIHFESRDLEIRGSRAIGIERIGNAAEGLARMGIGCITLNYAVLDDMALVIAFAQARRD